MIDAGLYLHHKSGNKYRVLFVGTWYDGMHKIGEPFVPDTDGLVSINGDAKVFPHAEGDSGLFTARWSGNSTHVVHEEPVVIYVALYGDGRVAARPLKEFVERVTLDGFRSTDVPRFERIGD